jgi:hypothetical protein
MHTGVKRRLFFLGLSVDKQAVQAPGAFTPFLSFAGIFLKKVKHSSSARVLISDATKRRADFLHAEEGYTYLRRRVFSEDNIKSEE